MYICPLSICGYLDMIWTKKVNFHSHFESCHLEVSNWTLAIICKLICTHRDMEWQIRSYWRVFSVEIGIQTKKILQNITHVFVLRQKRRNTNRQQNVSLYTWHYSRQCRSYLDSGRYDYRSIWDCCILSICYLVDVIWVRDKFRQFSYFLRQILYKHYKSKKPKKSI